MHRILARQLKRFLKGDEIDFVARYQALIDTIDVTYRHFDEDKLMTERSLEISSRELTSANNVLVSTIEATADGILVVDVMGKIILTNMRFLEMWRIPNEVIRLHDDRRAIEFVTAQLIEPERFTKKVVELYGSSETSLDILEFKDGRVFERYSKPLSAGAGASGRVWSFRDFTERSKFERLLQERANDLQQLNAYMVNREIKMADLKEENERLKSQPS